MDTVRHIVSTARGGRNLKLLLSGEGYPMFATHDPRLIGVVTERALWYDRKPGSLHALASRT
jgi:hypothetical protein